MCEQLTAEHTRKTEKDIYIIQKELHCLKSFKTVKTPMKTPNMDSSLPYVMLEGIKHGNRFITGNKPGEDPTKSAEGETWYRVLGYAATIKEAQDQLYDSPEGMQQALEQYAFEMAIKAGVPMSRARIHAMLSD
ncbi:MAG: hypothetical protein KGL39_52135 [Patescibacteria group bacterium]|nr:hypothetical protein [Patescibacteria group bacterium]